MGLKDKYPGIEIKKMIVTVKKSTCIECQHEAECFERCLKQSGEPRRAFRGSAMCLDIHLKNEVLK